MSKLVIGGASHQATKPADFIKFMDVAYLSGIREIDTAPIYGENEWLIGQYSKQNGDFLVNTKIGLTPGFKLSRGKIFESVMRSLELTNQSQFNNLFIHSLPELEITSEVVENLLELKSSGYIRNIGYSGDGQNLSRVVDRNVFDSIMATHSILDQSNLPSLKRTANHTVIYAKRALANGVFDKKLQEKTIQFLRNIKYKNLGSKTSYNFRYRKFFTTSQRFNGSLTADYFLNYVLRTESIDKVVVGVSQTNHLLDLIKFERNSSILNFDYREIESRFRELELSFKWESIT